MILYLRRLLLYFLDKCLDIFVDRPENVHLPIFEYGYLQISLEKAFNTTSISVFSSNYFTGKTHSHWFRSLILTFFSN